MIDSKKLLKEYGLNPNKALGQNFLTDENAVRRIVELSCATDKTVLEIGPGLGVLTYELARIARKVVTVEIDSKMAELLGETLRGFDNVNVINRDFLRIKTDHLKELTGGPFTVTANLPYYITSDAAMKLIDSPLPIERMVLMMQSEACEHFTAVPQQKCYTPISVITQRYFDVSMELKLSPACYYPEPAVYSAVLLFKRNEVPYDPIFSHIVKSAFMMRRKTIRNNFASIIDKNELPAVLVKAGVSPTARAEELNVGEFESLTECFRQYL